jgi:hypothetical protein
MFERSSGETLGSEEVVLRGHSGIHFPNADLQAANLGREVEAWTHTHYFAFVH